MAMQSCAQAAASNPPRRDWKRAVTRYCRPGSIKDGTSQRQGRLKPTLCTHYRSCSGASRASSGGGGSSSSSRSSSSSGYIQLLRHPTHAFRTSHSTRCAHIRIHTRHTDTQPHLSRSASRACGITTAAYYAPQNAITRGGWLPRFRTLSISLFHFFFPSSFLLFPLLFFFASYSIFVSFPILLFFFFSFSPPPPSDCFFFSTTSVTANTTTTSSTTAATTIAYYYCCFHFSLPLFPSHINGIYLLLNRYNFV